MSDNIVRLNCVNDGCGTFVMDRELRDRYKRTGETFHCPAGHSQHFTESVEQQLRKKISGLKSKIDRLENRLQHRNDAVKGWYDDYTNERDKRRDLERRYVEVVDNDGLVEIYEGEWMWTCRCGNTGRATFDTEAEARRAYGQHRDGHCELDAPEATA